MSSHQEPLIYDVHVETPSSKLVTYPCFDQHTYPDFEHLYTQERPPIRVFGRIARQNRNVAFYALTGVAGYRYSGQVMEALPIEQQPLLLSILHKVNNFLGTSYNGILINKYLDGNDYIGAHADDEKNLSGGMVASLAYGAVRKFRIRDKSTKRIVIDLSQQPGDLLVMWGNFQQEFIHEIPKEKKVTQPRISLTFREHQVLN